jgi:hypothetical protein
MGFQVKNISLQELDRISIPGKMMPTLFWVIPIGKWRSDMLDELWRFFTGVNTVSSNLGTMICDERWRRPYDNHRNYRGDGYGPGFSDVSIKLGNFLPGNVGVDANDERIPKVLILSAAFPQPGWGVMIEYPGSEMLDGLLMQACGEVDGNISEEINFAKKSFREFEYIKINAPRPPDTRVTLLIELLQVVAGDIKKYMRLGINDKALIASLNKLVLPDRENIISLRNETIELLTRERHLAFTISELSSKYGQDKVFELCDLVANLPQSDSPKFFSGIQEEDLRRLGGALYKSGISLQNRDLVSWELETYQLESLREKLTKLHDQVVLEADRLTFDFKAAEAQFDGEVRTWQAKMEQCKKNLQKHLKGYSEVLWGLGPKFLYVLEVLARRTGSHVKSISWDRARMVGWKIYAHGMSITLDELYTNFPAHSLRRDEFFGNKDLDSEIDGSLFTDYVHYLTITQNDRTPWSIAHEFIMKVLRVKEMKDILKENRILIEGGSSEELSAQVLDTFGWSAPKRNKTKPLASLIKKEGDDIILENQSDLSIVRKSLESFYKDLIRIFSAILGNDETELWEIMKFGAADYNRDFRRSWTEAVDNITIGSAWFFIHALADYACPDKSDDVSVLKAVTKELGCLNLFNHDNPDLNEAEFLPRIPVLIDKLLQLSLALVNEMPWHVIAPQRIGSDPVVISGESWSHSYSASRFMRVIVWDQPQSGEFRVWNPSKLNPIITDGRIV